MQPAMCESSDAETYIWKGTQYNLPTPNNALVPQRPIHYGDAGLNTDNRTAIGKRETTTTNEVTAFISTN